MTRVFARAHVGNLRAGRWADVASTDPRLADWLAMGLVSRTGPYGEPAPVLLPPTPCCGQQ